MNLPAGGHDTTDPHVLCEAPPIEHSKPHRPNKLCKILTYWRWRGSRRQYALGAAGITFSISLCIQREAYTQVVRIGLFHRSGTTSRHRTFSTVSLCVRSGQGTRGNGAVRALPPRPLRIRFILLCIAIAVMHDVCDAASPVRRTPEATSSPAREHRPLRCQ